VAASEIVSDRSTIAAAHAIVERMIRGLPFRIP
jgi:hypothetical protein